MENIVNQPNRDKWAKVSYIIFALVQSTVLIVFFVPFSWELVGVAIASYYLRMFGITGVYHRYFSHNAYKTSRFTQFVLAWLGAMAMQKGPLWWAAHHRDHHKYSDTDKDLHSPRKGFWHSHMLWFLKSDHNRYNPKMIKDYSKYPELRFIDRFYWIPPLTYAFQLYFFGLWIGNGNHTYAFAVLTYGYAVATFFLGHGTWTINSLSHVIGKKRFETGDDSKNNWFLAIITMGEGWHNNHHYYRHSANQGFYWFEIDFSYYILKILSFFGVIWDLKAPPKEVLEEGRQLDAHKKGKTKFKNLAGELTPIAQTIVARRAGQS